MPDRLLEVAMEPGGGAGCLGLGVVDDHVGQVAGWLEKLWPRLLAFTRRKLMRALATHYDPEDVLQDAVQRTWREPGKTQHLKGIQSFERWMKRVIVNRVMDLRRMISVRDRVWPSSSALADDGEGGEWDRLEAQPDPSTVVEPVTRVGLRGSGEGAARQIRYLPFEEHICVLMRDVLCMDWGTVSATLDRSMNGAKSLRHRARERYL